VAGSPTDIVTTDAIPPGRAAGALADAMSKAWRPYRLRAYVVGVVAGILVGGVLTPIATTAVILALSLAGITVDAGSRWDELLWSAAFVVAFAAAGAWALVRWLPRDFKAAMETYVWLAMRADTHWREQFGGAPVPRTPTAMRAFLDSTPASPGTAHERSGILLALGDVDGARRETDAMLAGSPGERYQRTAMTWLLDFASGTDGPLDPLRAAAAAIDDPAEGLEADVEIALDEARVAVAGRGDWITPAAAIRDRLGREPSDLMWRLAWRPAFRTMLAAGTIAVVVYWIILSMR
jgi:hypothetical protein